MIRRWNFNKKGRECRDRVTNKLEKEKTAEEMWKQVSKILRKTGQDILCCSRGKKDKGTWC